MSEREEEGAAAALHALNNLFSKIIGAAELAFHRSGEPLVRAELETIAGLAEQGGGLVAELGSTVREP
jgi:hypothetical protein